MVEVLLTSLLHRLSDESRWLLWLNPNRKLSRSWLINSELPLNKTVQINSLSPEMSVIAMIKALSSGNCSIYLRLVTDFITIMFTTFRACSTDRKQYWLCYAA